MPRYLRIRMLSFLRDVRIEIVEGAAPARLAVLAALVERLLFDVARIDRQPAHGDLGPAAEVVKLDGGQDIERPVRVTRIACLVAVIVSEGQHEQETLLRHDLVKHEAAIEHHAVWRAEAVMHGAAGAQVEPDAEIVEAFRAPPL